MSECMASTELTRRKIIQNCVGSLAALSYFPDTLDASSLPSEASGGGELCIVPPTVEGVERLAEIHENAQETNAVDRFEVADKYEFSLIPDEVIVNYKHEMQNYLYDSMDAVARLNEITEQWLGFKVSINMYITDEYARGIVQDKTLITAKLSSLLDSLSILPKELYQAINFTEILIEDIAGEGGDYTYSTGKIRLDPTSMGDPTLTYHELGHAINMTACGEAQDIALTNTLPEGIEYTTDRQNPDPTEGIFVSIYGRQNDREDAAMIIAAWMTGYLSLSEELRGEPLYDKLAIIMDRFETLVPGSVEYIEEIVRPTYDKYYKR